MTVAFDFDGCMSDVPMQILARELVRKGIDVWVVTARREGAHNVDLFEVIAKCGIPKMKVVFMDEKPKFEVIKGLSADIYIDNVSTEFANIRNYTKCVPLLY